MHRSDRWDAGFSLVELVIAVSVLVMMTGALSPALIRYVEKGRERRDAQNVEMVYSALTGAMYDEIAYDAVKSRLQDGIYSAPVAVSALFMQEDGFAEAVKLYIPTAPQLISRDARGAGDNYEIMISVREEVDQNTGIRTMQTAVWAGDRDHSAGEDYEVGVLPDTVTRDLR